MEFGRVLLVLTLGIIVVHFVVVCGLPMHNESNGTYPTTFRISTNSTNPTITTTQGIRILCFYYLKKQNPLGSLFYDVHYLICRECELKTLIQPFNCQRYEYAPRRHTCILPAVLAPHTGKINVLL